MPNRSNSNRKKLQPINVRNLTTIPETHIMFNLSCEPAFKYTLFAMCDRGEDDKFWTSRKLKLQTLYIENGSARYEITRQESADDVFQDYDKYRFSMVKNPFKVDNNFMIENNIPLSEAYVTVLRHNLDWREFLWGTD